MATATATPASPRLPSPPPIPEDQLSPAASSSEQQKLCSNLDHDAARRIRPGTRAEDMAEGPPLVELSEIDSAFPLTEHLKALHNSLTHPSASNGMVPVDKAMALKLAQPPDNVDKTLWLYELCRFLIQKVNSIIVALFSDTTPCSSLTCPEMRASEWQYLCAVHDPPKSCCAIDYCCHTLDWAANTLTSPKHFPSRLALGTDQSTQHSQTRQLTNIFRRVYRIFAHAWFQHRDMFWKVEGRTGLYVFYKTVCDFYGLIPDDNYTVPAEAEGIEHPVESTSSAPPLILKREPSEPGPHDLDNVTVLGGFSDNTLSTAGTTKRHRHSPSVGAMSVSTVVEEAEEEDEQPKTNSRPVTQIFESVPDDLDLTQSGDPDTGAETTNEDGKKSTGEDKTDANTQGDKEGSDKSTADTNPEDKSEALGADVGSTEVNDKAVVENEKAASTDPEKSESVGAKADEDNKSGE